MLKPVSVVLLFLFHQFTKHALCWTSPPEFKWNTYTFHLPNVNIFYILDHVIAMQKLLGVITALWVTQNKVLLAGI